MKLLVLGALAALLALDGFLTRDRDDVSATIGARTVGALIPQDFEGDEASEGYPLIPILPITSAPAHGPAVRATASRCTKTTARAN